MNGWIKLHRKIMNHWLYGEKRPFTKLEAWIDLMLLVNHEDTKFLLGNELVQVKRGERITSVRFLCDRWNWSNTKVKNFLMLLESEGMITHKSDCKKTIISIDKYDIYQGGIDNSTTEERRETITKTTEEQRITDALMTDKHTNKNEKNEKNVKNDNNVKKNELIPIKEIVFYLNQRAETEFKHNTNKTIHFIKARWNEGFRKEDFFKVIDKKTSEWKEDKKFRQYLRPETLFGPKFESYLNQKGDECIGELQYDEYDFL
jgi:uncharacterized phage protein (TIGR02220 family)